MSAAPPQATENPTSGVLALVFGIVGLVVLPVIGSILALVFGYQCRKEVAAEPHRYRDDLGRVGRILGWIGVALAAVGIVFFVVVFGLVLSLGVAAPL